MGEEVGVRVFSRDDRQRYRQKVRSCLDVFARMLAEARFHPERRSFGLEIELNLTDDHGDPAMVNARALEAIADPDFQTELGQFNVEINVAPRLLEDRVLTELEKQVRDSLNGAEDQARTVGAHMMIIGILPTVTEAHLDSESFSDSPRYELLNEQIFAARGEDLEIAITGVERLSHLRGHHRPRGRLHERPAASAGGPGELRRLLERRAGDRGHTGGHRGELTLLLRPRALAGDTHRAVRAGHRHAAGGAEGAGRAPAGLVRRALDHVDLRSVRGERALLPGAPPGV